MPPGMVVRAFSFCFAVKTQVALLVYEHRRSSIDFALSNPYTGNVGINQEVP